MIQTKERGFTLIELLLSMSFLSILLIAIAMMIMQVTNTYTKGVTLTSVNRAGQMISSELQQALNQSSGATSVSVSSNTGGRFCTGTATYVWNYPNATATTNNQYISGTNPTDIRFVKVSDPNGSLCIATGGVYPKIDRTKATELLQGQERNIVVRAFSPVSTTLGSQMIYDITVTVGTNNASDLIPGQNQCAPPSGGSDAFCAVNQFEFTARVVSQ